MASFHNTHKPEFTYHKVTNDPVGNETWASQSEPYGFIRPSEKSSEPAQPTPTPTP